MEIDDTFIPHCKLKPPMDSRTYFALYHSIQASGISLLENRDGLPTDHRLPNLNQGGTEHTIRVNHVAEYNKGSGNV